MPPLSVGQQLKALIEDGKFDEARRLVKANPTSKSQAVLDRIKAEEIAAQTRATTARNQIAEIKKAIAEKRYDDAEVRLLLSDHPDAEKYRQQIESGRVTIAKLESKSRMNMAVTPSPLKIKDNDDSPEKSIAVLFWFISALAALAAGISKLFN